MKPYLLLLAAASSALLASCAIENKSGGGLAAYNAYDRPAKLPTNPNNVRVKVSLNTGITYVMEGDTPLLVMPVGIGKAGTATPSGNFRIFGKNHYRRANTHGLASRNGMVRRTYLRDRKSGETFTGTPMPYWCEFKPAYGFHTGWIRPYPHTSGCIRMHHNIAPKFFRLVRNGTPVNIARSQPEDATHGREILTGYRPNSESLTDHPLDYYLTNRYFTDHKEPKFD